MKIVQSLWSKPGLQPVKEGFSGINKCSWPDKKYNYFSWALSAWQFRTYYDQLELVTDQAGYELLIEKMRLPYTNVRVELDRLNDYHPELWALGKIYAYSIQEQPFIHADGDVYIWEKFDDEFENAPLLCQHREESGHYNRFYQRAFMDMALHLEFIPEVLHRSIARNNCVKALNAGILGGCDLAFYKEYSMKVLEFVDRNIGGIPKINVGVSNIIFEQFMFYALAEEKSKKVRYYNDDKDFLWHVFADYTGIPGRTKYIHTPGGLKKERYLVEALEHRLQKDYPDCYYRIMHLIRSNQI